MGEDTSSLGDSERIGYFFTRQMYPEEYFSILTSIRYLSGGYNLGKYPITHHRSYATIPAMQILRIFAKNRGKYKKNSQLKNADDSETRLLSLLTTKIGK